jgi:YD repeat-containing protein
MRGRRHWIAISLAVFFFACGKDEPPPDTPILILQSIISADRKDELQRITTKFTHNENNFLIERQRNDTTYSKLSDSFSASQRKITYTYNEEGLLIKSSEEVISLTDFRTVEANYSYKNGQLVGEKNGQVTTQYTYDEAGELTKVVTTYPRGNVQEVDYNQNIPSDYEVENNGYSYLRNEVKSYYNEALQLVKREQFRDGEVTLLEERNYTSGKSYYDALPTFKGFPLVKSEAYGEGIRNTKLLYSIENGSRVLVEEEKFIPLFNANGFLLKNEGVDRFRLNTSAPEVNYVTYEYEYSR